MSHNLAPSLYSTCSVIRECGISARQLYYWELIGLLRPRYEPFGTRRFRRYSAEDVELLKKAKALLDEGFTLQAVRERLRAEGARPLLNQKGPGPFWGGI